jgi:hypothetical protein
MDNGLTQSEASEVIMHIAFHASWPNAFSALPVVKDVFEKRPNQTADSVGSSSDWRRCESHKVEPPSIAGNLNYCLQGLASLSYLSRSMF